MFLRQKVTIVNNEFLWKPLLSYLFFLCQIWTYDIIPVNKFSKINNTFIWFSILCNFSTNGSISTFTKCSSLSLTSIVNETVFLPEDFLLLNIIAYCPISIKFSENMPSVEFSILYIVIWLGFLILKVIGSLLSNATKYAPRILQGYFISSRKIYFLSKLNTSLVLPWISKVNKLSAWKSFIYFSQSSNQFY